MKTIMLLSTDCRKEEGKRKINKALMKIKPIRKRHEDEDEYVDIELLEDFIEKMCRKYNITIQSIMTSYLDEEVRWYSAGLMTRKERQWIDTMHGYTLWELMAKISIKLYVLVKHEEVGVYVKDDE